MLIDFKKKHLVLKVYFETLKYEQKLKASPDNGIHYRSNRDIGMRRPSGEI